MKIIKQEKSHFVMKVVIPEERFKTSDQKNLKISSNVWIERKVFKDGAPNYRVLVKAPNYKQAEEELKSAVDLVLSLLKKEGGIGSFERA